jgi:hypothetical protein
MKRKEGRKEGCMYNADKTSTFRRHFENKNSFHFSQGKEISYISNEIARQLPK